jgi:hypothetical protein
MDSAVLGVVLDPSIVITMERKSLPVPGVQVLNLSVASLSLPPQLPQQSSPFAGRVSPVAAK